MPGPLIAVAGDLSPTRTFDPPMRDPKKAKAAAEELGAELARRGARLLVHGGPFLEADVVRGFVAGKPAEDKSIRMCYSQEHEPKPFDEEESAPKLFERRAEKGSDWETAFYRSIARADGIVLMGGARACLIAGQVAIGARIPLLALPEFGGGAAKVWKTLSAGEDLPTREEIDVMAQPWGPNSASACVQALFAQRARRTMIEGAPRPLLTVVAALLFLAALAILPWTWGRNQFHVWMLFLSPLLAGGAGASMRPIVDHLRGTKTLGTTPLATAVLGLVAGGMAGVLFVTAQLTADPSLSGNSPGIAPYALRSIPFALAIGFVAGLTADAVFAKMLGVQVVRTAGVSADAPRSS